MSIRQLDATRALMALRVGMMIPFLYFGLQIVAAFFYVGYSFLNQDASTLGSAGSSLPWLFNSGAVLIGLLHFIAAWGYGWAFRQQGLTPGLSWLTVLALVASGIASINAGLFPLPDPRHSTGLLAILGAGTFLFPVLLAVSMWKLDAPRWVKGYLTTSLVLFMALLPVMSGLLQMLAEMAGIELQAYQTFLNNYHGLLQRIAAFIVLSPIALGAHFLAQRLRGSAPGALASHPTLSEGKSWQL